MPNNPKVAQRPQNMTPKQIRQLLFDAEVTQAEIARDCDKKPTLVYHVIEGNTVSDVIRKYIAKKVGVDIKRIWPDPYLIYGGPRKPGRPIGGERRAA
ncbi:MAG: hypothetical protein ABSC54_00655 [Smithellaceae bacterium]|jgi:lambda repressor-like predicted transcriptional regulator